MTVTITSGTRSPSARSVRSSAVEIDVALERMHERGHAPFRNHEVARFGALDLDVRAGRVEVVVVRDDLARLQHRVEQDALGRASLMRRDDVLEAR